LDPGFTNGGTVGDINNGAGWYDANPGTANTVTGGRMLLMQIVRTSANDTPYTANLSITYKVSGSSTPIQPGAFQYRLLINDPLCAGGPDCNNNGCNDARDIATGFSSDINANGVPDECDPDCNNNDIPDRYELAQGLVPDCNADSTPDDCQGGVRFALVSPNLGAPSGAQAAQYTFTGLRPAESGVTITVRASGDLSGQTEYIDPFLNGVPGARLFGPTGSDCPATPDVATLTLTREQFNTVLGSGTTLNLVLQSSAAVDPGECKGSGSLVAELKYFGIQPSGDCNGNQRLDVCEVYQGVSPDCNGNKKPDSCDIASGFSADCNTNGIPDSCDLASGLDCNTNGIPDSCDVAAGTSPDIDANNKPDECQTVTVNAGGSIQAAIDAAPANEMRIVNVAPGTYAGPINLLGKPIRLIGTGGAALTTISGTGGQSQSVIRAISGEPAISLVKGFTVKGGTTGSPLPQNPLVDAGGGILMAASSTSIEACILEQNNAAFGGGAYLYQHAGSVTGCTVRQNTAQAYGGGIQLYDSSTTVSGCTFTGNNAVTAGGGLHIVRSTPSLVGCTISGNGSFDRGGGISWDPDLDPSLLTIQQCQITGNDADLLGSGLFIYPTGVASETQLIGTTICGNAGRNVVGAYQADTASQVCDCRADLNGDGIVNGVDLATILSNWGTASATADLSGDGTVSGADLSTVLAAWGTCPST
jgi:parallel beta-helix repeat protein